MKFRKSILFLCLFIFLFSFYLLITSSNLLMIVLNDELGLPLGTISTWLAFIALSLSIYFSHDKLRKPINFFDKLLAFQLKLSIWVSISWPLISFSLAGNLNFSFSPKDTFQGGQLAMKIFWIINYSLVIIPILVLLSHHILKKVKLKIN